MLCHKCPHSAEIARLREICMKCSDKDVESQPGIGFGNSLVSIDNMVDPEPLLHKQAITPRTERDGEPLTQLPPEVEMRLRDELASFMRLSFLNQMLLIWIMRGENLSEFSRMDWLPKGAKEGGFISRQAVFERVGTLKSTMPELAGVIEQMVALNSGARHKRKVRGKPKKR